MSTLEVVTAVAAIIAAVASVCAPLSTAMAEVLFFGAMKMIMERLAPRAPPSAITADSKLECKFVVPDGMV